MYKLIASVICSLMFTGAAYAQATPAAAAASDCEAKAVSKDGKALAGAAKASFIKKCEADAKGGDKGDSKSADKPADPIAACEAKATGKDGKPLAGAAKAAFVKKCVADAKAAAKAGK